jgi:hypothetical protein
VPNGNTLACETNKGFEIAPSGEIVWEWLNPLVREGHRGSVYRLGAGLLLVSQFPGASPAGGFAG